MSKPPEKASIQDRLVTERIELLRADPGFQALCDLVPEALKGKESGKDYIAVTTQTGEFRGGATTDTTIVLSQADWELYERFQRECPRIAAKWKLSAATVEALAHGVEQPSVTPRVDSIITAYINPIPYLPHNFDPNVSHIARYSFCPPFEAAEIMRLVDHLDESTKERIQTLLRSLSEGMCGCHIVEISKARNEPGESHEEIDLDICLHVPVGFTGKEVEKLYTKLNRQRREVLRSLGKAVPQRRRESKAVVEAVKEYELLDPDFVGNLAIIEKHDPNSDSSDDKAKSKAIAQKRHWGRKQLRSRQRQAE